MFQRIHPGLSLAALAFEPYHTPYIKNNIIIVNSILYTIIIFFIMGVFGKNLGLKTSTGERFDAGVFLRFLKQGCIPFVTRVFRILEKIIVTFFLHFF